jgi:CubicO group peptidase (beta-lactamase class C family)
MKKAFLTLSICSILVAACGSNPSVQYAYRQPQKVNDGLDVGTLDEVNLDGGSIGAAVDDINSGKYGEVHSLLIYKDGKLVLEEYFPGHDYLWDGQNFHGAWVNWDRDKEHNVHSVGKSITSACVGIAVDRGYIESVHQSIFDYLPEHQHLRTARKDLITIEHLLTMTSGLEWDEWGASYSSEDNDVIALWVDCDDPVACVLEKPLLSEPGTDFVYSGGNVIVLGEIIKNATGMDIEAFSWEYLFGPLGVETPAWRWIEDSGVVYAGGDQHLTPREMLKFGVTYLNGGVWNGQQIVPEGWVENSAAPYSGPDNTWFNHFLRPIPPGDGTWGRRGYSYSWWTHVFSHSGGRYPAFWAFGWGGQKIVVLPDQDAVVVFTGGNYTSADASAKILTEHVIPALE